MPEAIQTAFPKFQVDGYCRGCNQYFIPQIWKKDGKRYIGHSQVEGCSNSGRSFGPIPDDVLTPWEEHGKPVEVVE